MFAGEEGLEEDEEEGQDGKGAKEEHQPVVWFAKAGGFFDDPLEEFDTGKGELGWVTSGKEMHQDWHCSEEEKPKPGGVCQKELHLDLSESVEELKPIVRGERVGVIDLSGRGETTKALHMALHLTLPGLPDQILTT